MRSKGVYASVATKLMEAQSPRVATPRVSSRESYIDAMPRGIIPVITAFRDSMIPFQYPLRSFGASSLTMKLAANVDRKPNSFPAYQVRRYDHITWLRIISSSCVTMVSEQPKTVRAASPIIGLRAPSSVMERSTSPSMLRMSQF
eukprot:2250864-Prymnesium_polylepis.1